MQETFDHIASSIKAAVLMYCMAMFPRRMEWPPTVDEVLKLTGSGKSQAYESLKRLRKVLPTLMGTPGRPVARMTEHGLVAVLVAIRNYVFAHPGAVYDTGERSSYSDGFRRFVVGLAAPRQPGAEMPTAELASACGIPLGTFKDWLHPQPANRVQAAVSPATSEPRQEDGAHPPASPADEKVSDTIQDFHLQVIAALWPAWEGTFQAFCQMLRTEQRLPHGDTFIGNVLQSLRLRHRRPQTPVEAPWSSGTFRTLFPGAQWLGDGTGIVIRWGNESFVFNVEALLDVASNGLVGFAVSNTEDEEALRRAYKEGLATTGSPPLALTLDNRPSNHSPGAVEATAGTILLRATPGRGQAKAAVEGVFGLFQQAFPHLLITGQTPREMAACALRLMLTAWFRGRNGKPRKTLDGRTPAEVYANARPTPEEIQKALAWFREQQRRQERARATVEARRDPVRITLLNEGLAELGIPDPEQRLAVALAYYGREAIVRGLAAFRSKQELGTLPSDADHGRYLGGIIRQLHTRLELELLSTHLLKQRRRLRDLTLAPLERAAQKLRTEVLPYALPQTFIDRALEATWAVDFRYWAEATADALWALPAGQRDLLYTSLCRRIAASFKTDRDRREDLIDTLAEAVASAA